MACWIVGAHPDDESLGLGGQMSSLVDPRVVCLTDGAPRSVADRDGYARKRRSELAEALHLAGLPPALHLDIVDQESAFHLVRMVRELVRAFRVTPPSVIFTHSYEGGHPDHDSAAFCVAAASALAPFRIREFTSYHNGSPHQTSAWMKTGEFLPSENTVETLQLSAMALCRKRRMLACHASQKDVIALFDITRENTRDAPRYDFTQPPHEGTLFYEAQRWFSGQQWRELAAAALEELQIPHDRLRRPQTAG